MTPVKLELADVQAAMADVGATREDIATMLEQCAHAETNELRSLMSVIRGILTDADAALIAGDKARAASAVDRGAQRYQELACRVRA